MDTSGIRDLLRDSVVLGGIAAACLSAGLVGAVSWHSLVHPTQPSFNRWESQEMIDKRTQEYDRDVANFGKDAVVPLAVAVPMTAVGLVADCVCIGTIIGRNVD